MTSLLPGIFSLTACLFTIILNEKTSLCMLLFQGKEGNPPRAGCPRANLRRTVADLVDGAGLSVVVCEEAPEPYSYGTARRGQKQRYVAAVVTPAAPHFLHGLVDEDADLAVESAPPLLGIVPTVGG